MDNKDKKAAAPAAQAKEVPAAVPATQVVTGDDVSMLTKVGGYAKKGGGFAVKLAALFACGLAYQTGKNYADTRAARKKAAAQTL